MTEAEKIAKGLTEAMRRAMVHPDAGGASFAWASRGTLEALRYRGLVGYRPEVGAFWSPQTAIKWPLTPLGLAVRKVLEAEKEQG